MYPGTIKNRIVEMLEKKGAKDINAIQVKGVTVMTDYLVIATAEADTHIKALIGYIDEMLVKKYQIYPDRRDDTESGGWSVLDYGGVIVHIFTEEMREKYGLDKYWDPDNRRDMKKELDTPTVWKNIKKER